MENSTIMVESANENSLPQSVDVPLQCYPLECQIWGYIDCSMRQSRAITQNNFGGKVGNIHVRT